MSSLKKSYKQMENFVSLKEIFFFSIIFMNLIKNNKYLNLNK